MQSNYNSAQLPSDCHVKYSTPQIESSCFVLSGFIIYNPHEIFPQSTVRLTSTILGMEHQSNFDFLLCRNISNIYLYQKLQRTGTIGPKPHKMIHVSRTLVMELRNGVQCLFYYAKMNPNMLFLNAADRINCLGFHFSLKGFQEFPHRPYT